MHCKYGIHLKRRREGCLRGVCAFFCLHHNFQLPSSKKRFYSRSAALQSHKVHRIIEWPGLKRTTMLIQSQPPAMCRVANQQPRLPRATSSLALTACRDGASTASLGKGCSHPHGSTERHRTLFVKVRPSTEPSLLADSASPGFHTSNSFLTLTSK